MPYARKTPWEPTPAEKLMRPPVRVGQTPSGRRHTNEPLMCPSVACMLQCDTEGQWVERAGMARDRCRASSTRRGTSAMIERLQQELADLERLSPDEQEELPLYIEALRQAHPHEAAAPTPDQAHPSQTPPATSTHLPPDHS